MIINKIKEYFKKKDAGNTDLTAPEGVCKTCWGHSEWDGKYYDVIKDKHVLPESDIYNSFINKIVVAHVTKSHVHEDKYICLNCNEQIK